jgi:hypothetical protein
MQAVRHRQLAIVRRRSATIRDVRARRGGATCRMVPDKFTMQQDQRDMGGPLTIEPPESD